MLSGEITTLTAALGEHGAAIKTYFDADLPWFQALVLAAFTALNSIRVLAYIPQIIKAAQDGNGATAISYTTWGLFFLSHLTTIFYAVVCLGDLIMGLIFLGNAVACLAIVLVTFMKRWSYAGEIEKETVTG